MSGTFRGMRCSDCRPDRVCDFHSDLLAAERREAEAQGSRPVERKPEEKPEPVVPDRGTDAWDYGARAYRPGFEPTVGRIR